MRVGLAGVNGVGCVSVDILVCRKSESDHNENLKFVSRAI